MMSSQKVTQRRTVLLGLSASSLACFWPDPARAGAAVAASLHRLLVQSHHTIVGTPRESDCHWEGADRARRIVTYSRIEVHQSMDGRPPADSSLLVKTLGGVVGDIGQLVHGEAELRLDEPAVMFLSGKEPGLFRVTAMAQGHYPLLTDSEGTPRLNTSPRIADFLRTDPNAAVSRLRGRTLADSERMIIEELGR